MSDHLSPSLGWINRGGLQESVEPVMATASANTSAAHVVRGLPRFRRPGRPALCRKASLSNRESRIPYPNNMLYHNKSSIVLRKRIHTRIQKPQGLAEMLRGEF